MSQQQTKKKSTPYFIALAMLWIVGCVLQYVFYCQGNPQPRKVIQQSSANTTTLTTTMASSVASIRFNITDEKQQSLLSADDNITFAEGSATLNPVPKAIEIQLKQLPTVVSDEQTLHITGYYLTKEKAPEGSINMGIARAHAIKDWLTQKGYQPKHIILASQTLINLAGHDTQHRIASTLTVSHMDTENRTIETLIKQVDASEQ